MADLVISHPAGNALEAEVANCTTIIIDVIETCEDPEACNTDEDGACEYPEDNYDCDGNCVVEEDCLGNCGGDAEYDECGVCDGDGPEENYDCDGNCIVEEDCFGDCGGDATEDECGVCDGPGYSYCWDGSAVCDLDDCPDQPSETVAIFFNSDVAIAGFQFNLDNVDILNAGGGAAQEAGFTLSNSSSTVIGFSLTGDTIPAGSGLLVQVEVQSNAEDACLSDLVSVSYTHLTLPTKA